MKKACFTFICFFVYMVVGNCIAFVWTKAGHIGAGSDGAPISPSPIVVAVSQMVSLVLATALLWATQLIRRRPWNRGVRLGGKVWTTAIVGFILLSFGSQVLLSPLELQDNGEMAVFDAMKGNAVCWLLLAVLGPLFEELVFREGIQRHLIAAKVSPLVAVLVSALCFALVHGNWWQAVPAVVLGFALGLCYLRTGDIRLCGLLHILNNSLAILLLNYPGIEAAIDGMPLGVKLGSGAVMTAAGVAMLYRTCRGVWRKA